MRESTSTKFEGYHYFAVDKTRPRVGRTPSNACFNTGIVVALGKIVNNCVWLKLCCMHEYRPKHGTPAAPTAETRILRPWLMGEL